ncbi:hypothetical protein EVG20_g8073 [Dentipellis fragilis]|uniref:Uncharacterized protein n=1 Tax=Dentipellis fragilis TaxID=205917 RepID=A0A4Y9Y7Y7_9AGAM|nr:hypothetical protein EVG20_g8073 [Dentipellis fragilis]
MRPLLLHLTRAYATVQPPFIIPSTPPQPPNPVHHPSSLDNHVLRALASKSSPPRTSLSHLIQQYLDHSGHVLESQLPYESTPPAARRVAFGSNAVQIDALSTGLDRGIYLLAHAVQEGDRHKVTLSSSFALSPTENDSSQSVIVSCAHTLEEIRWSPLLVLPTDSASPASPELPGARSSGSFLITPPSLPSEPPAVFPITSVLSSLHKSDLLLLSSATPSPLRTLPVSPYPAQPGTRVRAHFVSHTAPREKDGWEPWIDGTWAKWETGTVLGYRDFAGREAQPGTYDALSHMLFKPPPTAGSSGGPIIDEESGAVVGVMLGTRMDNRVEGVRGWGVPAEVIFELGWHVRCSGPEYSVAIEVDEPSDHAALLYSGLVVPLIYSGPMHSGRIPWLQLLILLDFRHVRVIAWAKLARAVRFTRPSCAELCCLYPHVCLPWWEAQGWPLLKGAAEFQLEKLIPDLHFNDSTLVVSPCNSSEQTPVTFGCAHAQQVIWQLLNAAEKGYDAAGDTDEAFLDGDHLFFGVSREAIPSHSVLLQRFGQNVRRWTKGSTLGLGVSCKAFTSEWKFDMDSPSDTHRHLSHLIGMYPGYAITGFNASIQGPIPTNGTLQNYTAQEVIDAATISLIHRGNGTGPDADSGWEKVWRAAQWAQLGNATEFYHELSYAIERNFGHNLFSVYTPHGTPFQIDANLAYPVLLVSVLQAASLFNLPEYRYPKNGLVQAPDVASYSAPLRITLLPALPSKWCSGKIQGARLRGGMTLDLQCADGKPTQASIVTDATGVSRPVQVVYAGNVVKTFTTGVPTIQDISF